MAKFGTDAFTELTASGAPFEITTEIVDGRPMQVYKNRPPHLRSVLEQASRFGTREAVVQGEQRLDYGALIGSIASHAADLADLGVGRGDRVAIVAANCPEWIVAFWATICLGAISVPLNAWWQAEELSFVLDDCDPSIVFCDRRRADGTLTRIVAPERLVVFGDGFAEARASSSDPGLPDTPIDEDDPAVLLYTSGTTGKPKGAVQTHRNAVANHQNLLLRSIVSTNRHSTRPRGSYDPAARRQAAWLIVVPLFHVTGLFTMAIPSVAVGGKIVFMPPGRFDPEVAMRIIEDEQVTIFAGVPTMMQRVLQSPALGRHDLSSLSRISYGGAPAPTDLQRRLDEAFPWLAGGGPTLAYGLTESAGVIASNGGDDYATHPDSCGRPLPTIEVRIVDETGNEVPTGERGEICARGPIIVSGYWNRPEATAATFVDGWLHTGDIGRVDDEGFIYILDRAKDMIIRAGENVYCSEVEDVICGLPGVAECAVVGVADADLGEKVKAVVVAQPSSTLDAGQVREGCRAHLAHYKVPDIVEIRSTALPRNPAGKVLKPALRGSAGVFVEGESDSAL